MNKLLKSTCSILAVLGAGLPAIAQDDDQDSGLEEIVVTGSIQRADAQDLSQSTTVLTGEALDHARSATLGETLDRLPGISMSSYGPAVGRPVIRGLGGDRIRVLLSGIGSIDASGSSPDHATAVDPATAESIEVLRGPSTLLFGNNAVGGVINVFDGRIPTQLPTDGVSTRLNAGYGSNGDEVSFSAWSTFELAEGTLMHLDAAWLDRGDISIPGEAESAFLIEQEEAEHDDHDEDDHDEHGEEEEHGSTEGTAAERVSGTVGLSRIFDNGFLGFSVSGMQSDYGLPAHGHGHEEEHEDEHEDEHGEEEHHEEEGAPVVELEQLRIDVMGGLRLDSGALKKVEFRFGWADYEHKEIEGDEIATVFANKGWELRVASELEQGDMKTILGAQARRRNFSAVGEEAFIGENITNQRGLFAVTYLDKEDWRFEGGARYERQTIDSDDPAFRKKFSGVSLSGSAIYKFDENLRASLLGFRTKRAPGAEELLSNGPHLATFSFERGTRSLQQETATGAELALRYNSDKASASVALFVTGYDDFIYQTDEDREIDELPLLRYVQGDAKFSGIEFETGLTLYETSSEAVHFHLAGDYVKATLDAGDEPLPRIPPFSMTAGLDYASGSFDASVQATWNRRQFRTAPGELPTAGSVRVDASLGYRPGGKDSSTELYVEARNLFNEEIRHHTSFLKDILPEPGRDIRLGVRAKF